MNEWYSALVIPTLGWVISVERRLSKLTSIKEQVDKVEAQVDRLVDHLIEKE